VSRPFHILVLADVPRDPNSGAPGSILALLREMKKKEGVRIKALLSEQLPHRIRHPKLHNLLEQPWGYLQAARRACSLGPIDLVVAHQPAGWLLAVWLRFRRPKTILVDFSQGFEAHVDSVLRRWRFTETPDPRPFWRRLATKVLDGLVHASCWAVARAATAHIVVNSSDRRFLMERYGVSPERILVLSLGVDEEYFETPLLERPERHPRILLVSQMEAFKAPRVSLGILSLLFEKDRALEATWVSTPDAQEKAAPYLTEIHRKRLRWLDWRPREELLQIYDQHDVLLFPSYFEGFGKVMVEAMARGLVVVATDQGGPRDVVRPGVDGWLFPVGDIAAGAAACWRVLSRPEERLVMSRHARERAQGFRWSRIAERLLSFYQEMRWGLSPAG
jgi:glycosyltransferase involved in cell wall biosynthesis